MVTLTYLRGLCGYVQVNMFTLSPLEGDNSEDLNTVSEDLINANAALKGDKCIC